MDGCDERWIVAEHSVRWAWRREGGAAPLRRREWRLKWGTYAGGRYAVRSVLGRGATENLAGLDRSGVEF